MSEANNTNVMSETNSTSMMFGWGQQYKNRYCSLSAHKATIAIVGPALNGGSTSTRFDTGYSTSCRLVSQAVSFFRGHPSLFLKE
ncbi:unnamed protein product [Cylindrotheca closterium]|uniref:Subtilisin n=1 Tax=Cylindrotheca closterium TaxID=2856 RepID=A0AAD2G244_9STRA|nr:unnamed protein product [Cylindrotheca closterium]